MSDTPVLLIVEDDEAFARTLGRSFERRGYRVLHAPGYEEAAEVLKQHNPGYAVVDQELELGLRSISVPVRGASGQVLAALNVGAQAGRVSVERMKQKFLPVLLRGAQELSVLLP